MIELEDRPITVECDLGQEAFVPVRFSFEDALNRPFLLELDLLAQSDDLDVDKVLGKPMSLGIRMPGGKKRWIHGLAVRLSYRGRTEVEGERYRASWRAEVRPWVWLLGRGRDSRIFQNLSVPDIVQEVFRKAGFSDFDNALSAKYRTREFCVQYRESDLAFVSRLMEEEGIRFRFRHGDSGHVLVLCDGKDGHEEFEGYESVSMAAGDLAEEEERDHMREWEVRHQLGATRVLLEEYDFTAPQADMRGESRVERKHGHGDLEFYDYPGGYAVVDDGRTQAEVVAQRLQAGYGTVVGRGVVRGLLAGSRFRLSDSPRQDQDREYIVTRYHLHGTAPSERSGSGHGATYETQLEAVPSEVPWRPARRTPRPVVQGPQTAEVVGPSGKDIWTDEHGRVKLQFHWDRLGERNEESSCWARVSQSWAGKGWGSMHLPHVGQEVIVEFLEGNPDRPIVTGRVYNGNHKTLEPLPDKQRVSGFRDVARNELLMDSSSGAEKVELRDTYGNELILDSAAKTATLRSPTHESLMVLGQSVEIKSTSDLRQLFGGNQETSVDGDSSTTVRGKEEKKVFGDFKCKLGGDFFDTTVGAFASYKLAATSSVFVGMKNDVSKSRSYAVAHGKSVSLYKSVVEVDHTDKIVKVRGKQEEFVNRLQLEGEEREERLKKIDTSCDEIKAKYEKHKQQCQKVVTDFKRELAKRQEQITKVTGDLKTRASKAVHDAKETVFSKVMKILK